MKLFSIIVETTQRCQSLCSGQQCGKTANMCCYNVRGKRCNKVYPGGSPNFWGNRSTSIILDIYFASKFVPVFQIRSPLNRYFESNCLILLYFNPAIFTFCGFIQILLLAKIPFPKWLLATNCINPNKFGIANVGFGLVYKIL